jgi:Glycosyl hydrolases family 43
VLFVPVGVLSVARRRGAIAVAVVVLMCVAAGCLPAAPPVGVVIGQVARPPQWALSSDPFVLADGGKYYVFASDYAPFRMPVHVVGDLTTVRDDNSAWWLSTIEGMPQKPAWTNGDHMFWAPTVARAANGTYVAFFAANRPNPPQPTNSQCIGRAVATRPEGPYVAEATPFTCGLNGVGGALDPNLFYAADGHWYLYAAFSGTDQSIYGFGLDANLDLARDTAGFAPYWNSPVYGKTYAWEGPFLENPAMAYDAKTQTYVLTYASGAWFTADYVTGLARCASPLGLCAGNPDGPWLAKDSTRTGTGGLSFFTALDGTLKAVYASYAPGTEGVAGRAATVASMSFETTRDAANPYGDPRSVLAIIAPTLGPP